MIANETNIQYKADVRLSKDELEWLRLVEVFSTDSPNSLL